MIRSTRGIAAALAALALATGCATSPAPATIAETAARRPDLSTFNQLVASAGLTQTLNGPGPYTVFAPSDDAFKAVPKATLDGLAKDPARLKAVLSYHVVARKLSSAEVKNGPEKTVQGANIGLAKAGTFVTAEDAVVTEADVNATNGVIHIVDRVLMPPAR